MSEQSKGDDEGAQQAPSEPATVTPTPLYGSSSHDAPGLTRVHAAALKAEPALDIPQLGRYVDLQPIGGGGGGQVFRAWDPALGRPLALKFLWTESPEMAERFRREARAQAGLEHDHVCKVYEVGEVDGRLFIAMQYVDGVTLRQAAQHMSIVEKVRVVKAVAEAIDAAHRLGMIHRDLKPSNVLVERVADAAGRPGWKPYVVDFGLVRTLGDQGQTATGFAVGTPQYMAPEQARGDGDKVDARTDVYGLGATLYTILADRPPFTGGSSADVMLKVLLEEVPRLRKLDPSLPRDLETITMTCLEKLPERRYPSARALAEDLGRFLDAEPVRARRQRLHYRLWKKARKHRVTVAAGALGLVGLAVTGGVALHARETSVARARLAQEFGQEVERIDSSLRFARLLPLHDVRAEKERVRERMRRIELELQMLGPVGEGPGQYALGRGHLTLGEPAEARRRLERAWQAGYRSPEAATALGLALGQLYERAVDAAERIDDGELRGRQKQEIERELRDPALRYLKLGAGARTLPPAYVEALIALHEGRRAEASAAARRALDEVPWLYEAEMVRGHAAQEEGSERQVHGDYATAEQVYAEAAQAYRAAQAIARSDARAYLSECRLDVYRLEMALAAGSSPQAAFEAALPACQKAQTAEPDLAEVDATIAEAWAHLSDWRQAHDKPDALAAVEQALTWGQKALARDGKSVQALNAIGIAYDARAAEDKKRGRDPRPSIDAGIDSYHRSVGISPTASALNLEACLYIRRAEWELEHGLDPAMTIRRASEILAQALEREHDVFSVLANVGLLHKLEARYQAAHGKDPQAETEAEIEGLKKALQVNPNFARLYREIGMAHALRAEHALELGDDPSAHVMAGVAAQERALELARDTPTAYINMAYLHSLHALSEVLAGRDPRSILQPARHALAEARRVAPKDTDADVWGAVVDVVEARWHIGRNDLVPARALLDRALEGVQRGLAANANDVDALEAAAEAHRWHAMVVPDRARDLEAGLEMTRRASALDPTDARAYALRATLARLAGRDDDARRDFDRAFALNGGLERLYPR